MIQRLVGLYQGSAKIPAEGETPLFRGQKSGSSVASGAGGTSVVSAATSAASFRPLTWRDIEAEATAAIADINQKTPSPTDQMLKAAVREILHRHPTAPAQPREGSPLSKSRSSSRSPRQQQQQQAQGTSLFPPLQVHSPRTSAKKGLPNDPQPIAPPAKKSARVPMPPKALNAEALRQDGIPQPNEQPVSSRNTRLQQQQQTSPYDTAAHALRPTAPNTSRPDGGGGDSSAGTAGQQQPPWRRKFPKDMIEQVSEDMRNDKGSAFILSTLGGAFSGVEGGTPGSSRQSPRNKTGRKGPNSPSRVSPVRQNMDLWSKMTLLDATKYNAELFEKRQREMEQRDHIRHCLNQQMEEKQSQKQAEGRKAEMDKALREQLLAEQDAKQRAADEKRKQRDTLLKQQLTEQLRATREDKEKRVIKEQLLDEAIRQELQVQVQKDMDQQRQRREHAKSVQRDALRYNAMQLEAREEQKKREAELDLAAARAHEARLAKEEAQRRAQQEKVRAMQNRSAGMALGLQATLEERMAFEKSKTERELREFEETAKQRAAEEAAHRKREAKLLKEALIAQVKSHQEQKAQEHQADAEESQRIRALAEQELEVERRKKAQRKQATLQHREEILGQVRSKHDVNAVVSSVEERLNAKRLEKLEAAVKEAPVVC